MAAATGDAATAAPAPAPATPAPGILSEAFGRRLFPYQQEGIAFAVAAGGRCLIADEMGLGKTAQAIGVLGAFAADLPALIVVPASVKFSWASELEKWTTLPAARIKLIRSRNDCDALRGADVVILTYGMLNDKAAVVEAIQRTLFRIVVLDESHAIKNSKSQRYQLLAPILRNAQRLIMLSGTPALARPVELYTQVSAIAPAAFGSFPAYTKRFCNAHQGRFGWDVSGASNVQELHEKLKTVMIRRLKKAVLTQLPDKIRQRVMVEVPPDKLKAMKATIAELDELKRKAFGDDGGLGDPDDSGRFEHGRVLNDAYRMTGEAKIQGAIAYLQDALEGSWEQILVFAHHKAVLDAMERALNRSKTTYIRIDGSTPTAERHRLVTTFQKDAQYRVALLSLTAAGQGITLTAATRVIFAELHWTPGVLLQAEDRAHRIGQKSHVSIVYLVAEGYTVDSIVWGILAKKTHLLSKTLDGKANKLEAEVVKKGQAGGSGGKGKVVTGEEELTMFFAAEQDGRGAGGGSGGRSGGSDGSAGGGSFPKGDLRGFFARPSSTTPSTSSKAPPPPPPSKQENGEQVVLLVDDDDDDDDENTESEGEVELILPLPPFSASASKPAVTAGSASRSRVFPAVPPPQPLGPRQQPPSSNNNDNVLIWSCGTCTYNNRRPRPAPSSKAPVTCAMCETPAPPALQPQSRGVGSKSKAPATPAPASSSSSSFSTAAAGAPPKKLAKTADQAAFSSAAAAANESEEPLRDRLTFSVSENTGRITLEESSGGPPRAAPSSPPPTARCNFSIDEYKEVVAAKGAAPSSLVNTPFEALAAALPARLAADGGRGGNHADDDGAVCQALLAEVGHFVAQWTALRGWERKALGGRALRLPLAAQLQAVEEGRRKQQGPCFDRYLPPASGASASSGDQSRAPGGAGPAPPPAYVPGKPKPPLSMATTMVAAPRPSKSPGSQASQQSSSQPPECAWCHVQITDVQTLSNLALQQGVGGARRGHVYCSFSCGEELLLRAGSSSLIRRQLFAMEAGVCQLCGRDAQGLFHKVKSLTPPERVQELIQLGVLKHFPETAIQRPQEHHFWQADHELPVVEGGGQCGLENLRTLCVPCHHVETAALRQRMKQAKNMRAATGTKDIRACFGGGQGTDSGGSDEGEMAH